ncbi:hypothetical protein HMPREF0742_01415 [Rothia aeria F0184]|uniref:Uncharacterized protein n=1 Tax=Rothia aeria F0184 TaxID=888019 RepID=U7V3C9_9MICC|nr:hypothetical protein HMPREF0742_01415 [Rothia aeria F0184]
MLSPFTALTVTILFYRRAPHPVPAATCSNRAGNGGGWPPPHGE